MIKLKCQCGKTFGVKDGYSKPAVDCPECHSPVQMSTGVHVEPKPPEEKAPADVFDRDQFLLRQKHLAISEKYSVSSVNGKEIIFVQRPAMFWRMLLALFAGVIALTVCMILIFGLAFTVNSNALQGVLIVLGIVISFTALFFVIILLYPKRHVYFYRDNTKKEKILEVKQVNKLQLINAKYTVMLPDGTVLAHLRKNFIYNIFRKRWYCNNPDGTLLCVIKEDSLVRSILRRALGSIIGIFAYMMFRTNFIFLEPGDGEKVIGEFNRKLTILDRYVLDMTKDPQRKIDRRIAVAAGVMLDTGERR